MAVIAGENNSGKSNLLRAITLPFLSEDTGYGGKTLSWLDINNDAKDRYYEYLLQNKDDILQDKISEEDFLQILPVVAVEVQFSPEAKELFWVKELSCNIVDDEIVYSIRYEFRPKKGKCILSSVKNILSTESITENLNGIKLSLLPTDSYEYSIFVPGKGPIAYDILKQFRYMFLTAERDDFSNSSHRIGSKLLVKLLQMKIGEEDRLKVEKKYAEFFDTLKGLSGMENILNWQNTSEIKNAEDFFKNISILPNMPPMTSILNSVRLGYNDENLSMQGLGYRNLILLLVLINSLFEKSEEIPLRIIEIEEPEAHLCINNIRLVVSFIKAFMKDNNRIQIICTTHSTELINKLDLENIILMNNGCGYSLKNVVTSTERDYLAKNPNMDLFKFFYSKRCILVEGLTEELLIRAYLDSRPLLSEIEVLSFHKGYKDIIKIWKKLNEGTDRKLGIVRDYDDQENAKAEHEALASAQVCVKTTSGYTLETDIVNAGKNYNLLKDRYGDQMGWTSMTAGELQEDWRQSKSYIMLQLCHDLRTGGIPDFTMPEHISEILQFMEEEVVTGEN